MTTIPDSKQTLTKHLQSKSDLAPESWLTCVAPFSGNGCKLQLYSKNFIFNLNIAINKFQPMSNCFDWEDYSQLSCQLNYSVPSLSWCLFGSRLGRNPGKTPEALALPRLATFYSSLSPPLAALTLFFHLWLHASAAPHLRLSNVHLAWLYKSIQGVRRENVARTCGPFHPHGSIVRDAVGKQVPANSKLWVQPIKWN